MALLLIFYSSSFLAAAEQEDPLIFDDVPLKEMFQHPEWFKDSFLDLQEDLQEALDNGKQGIIVYFGQKRCPYCRQLMEINFKQPDIVKYTRDNFDVIAIDIWSPEEVTDPAGNTMSQRDYALKMRTNFTPSLVFYDAEGNIALRLRGYYPPYQFRAALEYVAGEHYKRERFNVYLARGDSTLRFEAEDMVEEDFFLPPPHNLDRSRFPGERPLAVFFEQGNCHACDILHTQLLRQPAIQGLFGAFESVQLDMHADDPVITPGGKRLSARQWANSLGIFYAPTLIFFDEKGQEIIRVDSVVHFFRLRNVLNYVLTKGYLSHPSFQLWRSAERNR
ncbi:MAG TPA: thioredoxin [Thiolapillus brandeum]|uniref:Thioredoxin n=1 Tax=Thiolapillus brandeum TaxID=1076588 RepID=A0A831KC49_9GAMM|nr:thioredoxin [Thiolapillus brandeum]